MKYIFVLMLTFTLAGCATVPRELPAARTASRSTNLGSVGYAFPRKMFSWPVRGPVSAEFGSMVDNVINKGIDIKAPEGASVRAAKPGRVIYCDPYLKGFGKTIILDHGDNYETVYSYASDILVNVGAEVSQNEVIAKVGRTGRAKEPCLHFEVRRNGQPQNPVYYLSR